MAVVLNPKNPNDTQTPQQAPGGTPPQTIGTATPAAPQSTGAPAPASQPQGSGRFTNIQKYLQANQQGGQQIANQIGQNLQNQYSQKANQAKNYYNQLGQSVQQANQTAQAGQGYQKQLQDIGTQIGQTTQGGLDTRGQGLEGIQNFTQSPNFQQFQNIQSGNAINENLLGLEQQKAQAAAQSAAQGSAQAKQQLGSETGRYDLLRKQFGGSPKSNYSQGQENLDQMLFGQSPGVNQLQNQATQQNRQDVNQLNQAQGQAGTVNSITGQEQGLIQNINKAANSNEQAYLNMLASYGQPLQTQRDTQFQNLGQAVQTYVPTYDAKTNTYTQQAYKPGFTAEQMANLGLTDKNQGVYNVFKGDEFVNPTGTTDAEKQAALASAVANKGQAIRTGTPIETAQDVANTQDVGRYQALAKIIGKDFVPQITQESQIGNAYNAKNDAGGLKERLDAAQQAYDEAAKNTQIKQQNGGTIWGVGANAQDLINKAGGALQYSNGKYSNGPDENYLQEQLNGQKGTLQQGYGQGMLQNTASGVNKQLQNFLDQQNYNRTLGGQRQTYLDTLHNQEMQDKGLAPKMETTGPITGTDPSLAYKNAYLDLLRKKGT